MVDNIEESTFHGGFGKIHFLRIALYKVTYARNHDDWSNVYRWLQSIYREVYPYFTDKEAKAVKPLWDEATKEFLSVKSKGQVHTKLPSLCFELELELMRVMKAHSFDAKMVNPLDLSGGASATGYQT